jgi:hypothetical protein
MRQTLYNALAEVGKYKEALPYCQKVLDLALSVYGKEEHAVFHVKSGQLCVFAVATLLARATEMAFQAGVLRCFGGSRGSLRLSGAEQSV